MIYLTFYVKQVRFQVAINADINNRQLGLYLPHFPSAKNKKILIKI